MRFPRLPLLSVAALAAALVTFPVGPAGAAEPSASEIAVARRLFAEGEALEARAEWAQAAERFRKAAAIKETPGIRFHVARCEEERGALVEALVEYDRARELIDAGAKAPDVDKLLGPARDRVQARLAFVVLRLPPDVAGVTVEVDGKPVSSSVMGVPLPLNPGVHRVVAAAPSRATRTQTLELRSGESREVTVSVGPAPVRPAVSTAAARPQPVSSRSSANDGSSWRTPVLVGEASLVAAGLGTGIAFTLKRSSAEERFDNANARVLEAVGGMDEEGAACAPPEPVDGCAQLQEARDDRERAKILAAVGFIGAGVSAAAFGLTWLLWPEKEGKLRVDAGPTGQAGFQLLVSGRL